MYLFNPTCLISNISSEHLTIDLIIDHNKTVCPVYNSSFVFKITLPVDSKLKIIKSINWSTIGSKGVVEKEIFLHGISIPFFWFHVPSPVHH